MLRVMIADESEEVRTNAALILEEFGFSVSGSSSALDAFSKCQTNLYNIVIVDAGLTGALDLIGNIRKLPNAELVQIYYGLTKTDLRSLMTGKTAGANNFLLKPFDRKVLGAAFSAMTIMAA